jgi:hypothetical protein
MLNAIRVGRCMVNVTAVAAPSTLSIAVDRVEVRARVREQHEVKGVVERVREGYSSTGGDMGVMIFPPHC